MLARTEANSFWSVRSKSFAKVSHDGKGAGAASPCPGQELRLLWPQRDPPAIILFITQIYNFISLPFCLPNVPLLKGGLVPASRGECIKG